MNLLSDVITYVRRIIKTPSNAVISDELIIDYINRFWIMDVDARMQLFDLKTKYQFQTTPAVDKYNMPLYNPQISPTGSNQLIAPFPVYQGFLSPAFINGVPVFLETQKDVFYRTWLNVIQNLQVVAVGNGGPGPYNIQLPILSNTNPLNPPVQGILRGHVDITGIIATGANIDPPLTSNGSATIAIPQIPTTSVDSQVFITSIGADGSNVVVADSGQFLLGNVNYGLLMQPGAAPYGNAILPDDGINPRYSTTSNTINYLTGEINVIFPVAIPQGVNINVQCRYFSTGLPRSVLFYNNTLTLRSPPDKQYLVELDAYLTPAAFLSTGSALPFGYMAEYIARGAARKILADTGDVEQFQFYEPLFREQENLVWKRSQRQWTATRTQTIYSQGQHGNNNNYNQNSLGI